MNDVPPPFEKLIGEELSAVVFVRDYLQLEFNPPPRLNVMTPMIVESEGRRITQAEDSFANTIIAQIGKFVASVRYSQDTFLSLDFSDGSSIIISLKPDDYVGAEAVLIFCKDHEWGVL